MKNKKILIILLGFIIVIAAIIVLVIYLSNNNVAKYYMADIQIDEYGHITVEETIVIKYHKYNDYIKKDINSNKPDYNSYPYNEYDISLYKDNVAEFDLRSVKVTVYIGNIFSNNDCKDITKNVDIGYSFNNDKIDDILVEATNENYESIWIDFNKEINEEISIVYKYTIYGIISKYNDCAELNYIVLDNLDRKIKTAVVRVYLVSNSYTKDDFYGGIITSKKGEFKKITNYEFNYRLKKITEKEKFGIKLVFPHKIVSKISNKNVVNVNLLESLKNK